MKCIFATNNEGKLREMKEILKDWKIELVGLKEEGIDIEVEETGKTYLENALIKAKAIFDLTGLPVLSDDSGMSVDALEGAPGIYSARFGGEDLPFSEKKKKIIEMVKDEENKKAAFHCAVVLITKEKTYTGEGLVEGVITSEERGDRGFGYDAIFELPNGKTFAEFTAEEKHEMSHRKRAIEDLERNIRNDKDTRFF